MKATDSHTPSQGCGASETRSFAFGPFTLMPERQLLLRDEAPVRIGGRALDLLTALVERPGAVVSKDDLFLRAWPDTFVDEGNLRVNMAGLRRALGEAPGEAQYIATVVGRGYRFVAPVRASASLSSTPVAAAAGTARHALPNQTSRILGREASIDAIRRDLTDSRVVSIVGAGGIGKTTVAIAAARAVAQDFADGITFVDLSTISSSQFLPAAMASALGLGATSTDPFVQIVRALQLERRVLVLDNCEHLLPAAAAAAERLTSQLGGLRIIATSREPLRIRGERVHRLQGLASGGRERPTAEEANMFPAVALFALRAAERTEYELTNDDAPAVTAICRRLEGNALAIELAAMQTAAFSPTRILRMLDDPFRLLKLRSCVAPPRQQSVLANLDWSYSLLTESEAALLRALCVFAGNFSVDGATAVSSSSPAEVVDALAQLAAKSLLAMDASADAVLFRLPETTRAYCLERLQAVGG